MSRTLKKVVMSVVAVVCAVVLVLLVCVLPILKDAFQSARQKRVLQTRSDYPRIAAACVAMTSTVTNGSFLTYPTNNPAVPPFLRSLFPSYITVRDGYVNLEFHGGFDHYGYRVRPVGSNQWTIFYYTEESERPLATVTNN